MTAEVLPPPMPTATWWARRWLEKAEPAERLAMRQLVAADAQADVATWLRSRGWDAAADDLDNRGTDR